MRYQISSKTSGAVLGTYEGDSPAAALDAMAQDAGYADHREACIQSGDDGSHLIVRAISAETVTAAARTAYSASLDATGDHGCAYDAASDAIRELVGERTGTFDAETLTWTYDADARA